MFQYNSLPTLIVRKRKKIQRTKRLKQVKKIWVIRIWSVTSVPSPSNPNIAENSSKNGSNKPSNDDTSTGHWLVSGMVLSEPSNLWSLSWFILFWWWFMLCHTRNFNFVFNFLMVKLNLCLSFMLKRVQHWEWWASLMRLIMSNDMKCQDLRK